MTNLVNAVVKVEEPPKLLQLIESRRESIAAVLPNNMSVERFIKVTWLAMNKNPDLLLCTPQSILGSVIEAAEVGLEPTGSLSRAWLVPYNVNVGTKQNPKYEKQAQLQIGYQGLADLARNSGDVTKIESRVVYKGDLFEAEYGTTPGITHVPAFLTSDVADIEKFYAVAYFKDRSIQFDVMTKAQVDGIRARAKSANNGPWVTDYAEMGRKTVTRRLMKSLALSPETAAAVQRDIDREVAAPALEAGPSRSAELRKQLQARVGHVEGPEPVENDPGASEIVVEGNDTPAESAGQQTGEPAAVVAADDGLCGQVAGPGINRGEECALPAGHKRATHLNAAKDSSWAQ